jgi:hypothetical protein
MRNVLRFGLASAALVISVVPAWSGVQPEGRELRVNLQLDSKQLNPVAVFAGNGSSAVVWENEGKGLRALFYGRDGNASTGEVALVANQSLPSIPGSGETVSRRQPAALFLASGELALAWVEERAYVRSDYFNQDRKVLDQKIAFQRFTASGHPLGSAALLHATGTAFQQEPRIALLGNKILVVWGTAGGGVSGRLLNPAGRPTGDVIAIAGAGASGAAVANSRNQALVTWSASDGNDTGVFAQILDAAGTPVGSSFRVNSTTGDRQHRPAVATGPDGGFLVLWQSRSHVAGVAEEHIFGQLVGAAGNLIGAQLQIDAGAESGVAQMAPAVAPSLGGRFLVTWLAWPNNGAGLEIAGREIDVAGQAVGDLFWLTEQRIERNFRRTSLATDGAGHFLMPWETIFRQRNRVIGARRLGNE